MSSRTVDLSSSVSHTEEPARRVKAPMLSSLRGATWWVTWETGGEGKVSSWTVPWSSNGGSEGSSSREGSAPSSEPPPPLTPPSACLVRCAAGLGERDVGKDPDSDMLSHLRVGPRDMRGVGSTLAKGLALDAKSPRFFELSSSAEELELPIKGETAAGGESEGSRRGEYAGGATTGTTMGARSAAAPAAPAAVAVEEEDGLSFPSATSLASSSIIAATTVAVTFRAGDPSSGDDVSFTGGSDGIGERRRRGEDSGDKSNESVLATLPRSAIPARLSPALLVLLFDCMLSRSPPVPAPLPLPRPPLPRPPLVLPLLVLAGTKSGGRRGVNWEPLGDGVDSDPEDSDRSLASIGLMRIVCEDVAEEETDPAAESCSASPRRSCPRAAVAAAAAPAAPPTCTTVGT